MRTLIVGDVHIDEKCIGEVDTIFKEICSYEADRVVLLGDFYDKKKLTPKELYFGTMLIKDMIDKYKQVYIIKGNHDKETLEYLLALGAYVVESLILDEVYYGHFFVHNSVKAFNSASVELEPLVEKYKYVILGHQHLPQVLEPNKACHLGSIRYVDFGEVEDKFKQIAIIDNEEITFHPLKTPIKMIDVYDIKDLDSVPENTKVRLIVQDFNALKGIVDEVAKFKDKFYEFKLKLDFKKEKRTESSPAPITTMKEHIGEWIRSIGDQDVKDLLIYAFKELEYVY